MPKDLRILLSTRFSDCAQSGTSTLETKSFKNSLSQVLWGPLDCWTKKLGRWTSSCIPHYPNISGFLLTMHFTAALRCDVFLRSCDIFWWPFNSLLLKCGRTQLDRDLAPVDMVNIPQNTVRCFQHLNWSKGGCPSTGIFTYMLGRNENMTHIKTAWNILRLSEILPPHLWYSSTLSHQSTFQDSSPPIHIDDYRYDMMIFILWTHMCSGNSRKLLWSHSKQPRHCVDWGCLWNPCSHLECHHRMTRTYSSNVLVLRGCHFPYFKVRFTLRLIVYNRTSERTVNRYSPTHPSDPKPIPTPKRQRPAALVRSASCKEVVGKRLPGGHLALGFSAQEWSRENPQQLAI